QSAALAAETGREPRLLDAGVAAGPAAGRRQGDPAATGRAPSGAALAPAQAGRPVAGAAAAAGRLGVGPAADVSAVSRRPRAAEGIGGGAVSAIVSRPPAGRCAMPQN